MSFSGTELKECNDKIVSYVSELKKQRTELNYLIERQMEEKKDLQLEMERIAYKLKVASKIYLCFDLMM